LSCTEVLEYDERRSGETEKDPVRHAGWMYKILREDIDLEENDFSNGTSSKGEGPQETVMIY
jgi:hypothetical protein